MANIWQCTCPNDFNKSTPVSAVLQFLGPLPMQYVGVWLQVALPKINDGETWTYGENIYTTCPGTKTNTALCAFSEPLYRTTGGTLSMLRGVLLTCHPTPVESEPWWHLLLCHSRSPVQRLDRPLPSGTVDSLTWSPQFWRINHQVLLNNRGKKTVVYSTFHTFHWDAHPKLCCQMLSVP